MFVVPEKTVGYFIYLALLCSDFFLGAEVPFPTTETNRVRIPESLQVLKVSHLNLSIYLLPLKQLHRKTKQ
jgi:hypothetical protein